jgi:hypothetical protein
MHARGRATAAAAGTAWPPGARHAARRRTWRTLIAAGTVQCAPPFQAVAYDGTEFAGFQFQAGKVRTVQGELEKAAARVLMLASRCVGASRTDGGAHAMGQVRLRGRRGRRPQEGSAAAGGAARAAAGRACAPRRGRASAKRAQAACRRAAPASTRPCPPTKPPPAAAVRCGAPASPQVVHLDARGSRDSFQPETLQLYLNGVLPSDVKVCWVCQLDV